MLSKTFTRHNKPHSELDQKCANLWHDDWGIEARIEASFKKLELTVPKYQHEYCRIRNVKVNYFIYN